MFTVDHKSLRLSFNEFHIFTAKDLPQYGEYCLLELRMAPILRAAGIHRGAGRPQPVFFYAERRTLLIRKKLQDGIRLIAMI